MENSRYGRKLLAVLLVVVLALALAACGKKNDTKLSESETVADTETLPDTEMITDVSETEIPTEEPAEAVPAALVELPEEDSSVYGNSIGNMYNEGALATNDYGGYYLYDMYEGAMYLFSADVGLAIPADTDVGLYLNYVDGVLYGTDDDLAIYAYDLAEDTTQLLREADDTVAYLQVVDDVIYFTAGEDSTLRSLPVTGGEETVLIDEPVYYPVVYKNWIIFQRDGDGESLYAMPLDGGDMVKLNDVASYQLIVDADKVYYQAKEGEDYSLRVLDLADGSERTLYDGTPYNMNISDGKLYFIREEACNCISYIDLSDPDAQIQILNPADAVLAALKEIYGEDAIGSFALTACSEMNICGDYMLFLCSETIDGTDYTDEYLYNLENDTVLVIPAITYDYTDWIAWTDDITDSSGSSSGSGSSGGSYQIITTATLEEYAQEVIDLVNKERASAGLGALTENAALMDMTAVRAGELAQKFSHTRPDGTTCFTVTGELGYSLDAAGSMGENIAFGQTSPTQVMNSWMNSSGHRSNILGEDYNYIGVGVYCDGSTLYWVQMFSSGDPAE